MSQQLERNNETRRRYFIGLILILCCVLIAVIDVNTAQARSEDLLSDEMKSDIAKLAPCIQHKNQILTDIARIIRTVNDNYTETFFDKSKLDATKKDVKTMSALVDDYESAQAKCKKEVMDWFEAKAEEVGLSKHNKHVDDINKRSLRNDVIDREYIALLRQLSTEYSMSTQLAEKPRGKIALSEGEMEFTDQHDLDTYTSTLNRILKIIEKLTKIEEQIKEEANEVGLK